VFNRFAFIVRAEPLHSLEKVHRAIAFRALQKKLTLMINVSGGDDAKVPLHES
jgi:hypothetical protein